MTEDDYQTPKFRNKCNTALKKVQFHRTTIMQYEVFQTSNLDENEAKVAIGVHKDFFLQGPLDPPKSTNPKWKFS